MRAKFPPPIAKSISVSRIASPHSTDRNIYNASINSLKKWFEDAKRIVCEGDIISIPIDGKYLINLFILLVTLL